MELVRVFSVLVFSIREVKGNIIADTKVSQDVYPCKFYHTCQQIPTPTTPYKNVPLVFCTKSSLCCTLSSIISGCAWVLGKINPVATALLTAFATLLCVTAFNPFSRALLILPVRLTNSLNNAGFFLLPRKEEI